MRQIWALGAMALVSACAGSVDLPSGPPAAGPFAASRGSALPPDGLSVGASQTAPPEGPGPGGLDFGSWRSADPAVYQPQFSVRVAQRLEGKSADQARADLTANGFVCRDLGQALECRIEIMERQCAHDWYVVLEPSRASPISGYDVMCLGANPG